jgi:hypothetical protein
MASNARIMVVANRTADSPELIEALRRRSARALVRFTLVVPAVPHGFAWAADMTAGRPEAVARAELALRRMRLCGLDLERAIVGDPDPVSAVGDALHGDRYDEVIVAAPWHGIAHRLRISLADRLQRMVDVPVSHVAAHTGPGVRL